MSKIVLSFRPDSIYTVYSPPVIALANGKREKGDKWFIEASPQFPTIFVDFDGNERTVKPKYTIKSNDKLFNCIGVPTLYESKSGRPFLVFNYEPSNT